METNCWELSLPGFRFHPTDDELLEFYLERAVRGKKLRLEIIRSLNIYLYHPLELPGMARIFGDEREWYFFVPRDRSNNGGRTSRTTRKGYWKATGSDRPIRGVSDPKRIIGLKKTLVFYEGRAPRGKKTDWVMNEFRLPEADDSSASPSKEDTVLCKVYRKATPMKELERAAMEKDATAAQCGSNDTTEYSLQCSSEHDALQEHNTLTLPEELSWTNIDIKVETEADALSTGAEVSSMGSSLLRRMAPVPDMLQEALPLGFDWPQDPFQMTDNYWSPLYANFLGIDNSSYHVQQFGESLQEIQ